MIIARDVELQAGFVNTLTGRYTLASRTSTPGARTITYDHVVGKWLVMPADWVSPDGKSYAYTNRNAEGSQLHVHDLISGRDYVIWSRPERFDIEAWRANGILLVSEMASFAYWVIDPKSGAVTTIPGRPYPFRVLPGDPPGSGIRAAGYTLAGEQIWSYIGMGAPGNVNWVFYEDHQSGQRVYIYKGTGGGSDSFDGLGGFADSTGIWFSEYYGGSFVWHWRPGEAPVKVPIRAVPPDEFNTPFRVDIAGPCF